MAPGPKGPSRFVQFFETAQFGQFLQLIDNNTEIWKGLTKARFYNINNDNR
jgi:hypothetical protein